MLELKLNHVNKRDPRTNVEQDAWWHMAIYIEYAHSFIACGFHNKININKTITKHNKVWPLHAFLDALDLCIIYDLCKHFNWSSHSMLLGKNKFQYWAFFIIVLFELMGKCSAKIKQKHMHVISKPNNEAVHIAI